MEEELKKKNRCIKVKKNVWIEEKKKQRINEKN